MSPTERCKTGTLASLLLGSLFFGLSPLASGDNSKSFGEMGTTPSLILGGFTALVLLILSIYIAKKWKAPGGGV